MQQPAEDPAAVSEPRGGEEAVSSSSEPNNPSYKRKGLLGRVAEHLSWTDSQRRGLIVVLFAVLIVLIWRAIRDRAFISDPQPPTGQRAADLASRLDPNSATWEELAALPQLGEKRAHAIVEHRDEWHKWHPNELPFKEPLDLVAVKGIGGSTVENLSPYLTFPPMTQPASKPSRKSRSSAK